MLSRRQLFKATGAVAVTPILAAIPLPAESAATKLLPRKKLPGEIINVTLQWSNKGLKVSYTAIPDEDIICYQILINEKVAAHVIGDAFFFAREFSPGVEYVVQVRAQYRTGDVGPLSWPITITTRK